MKILSYFFDKRFRIVAYNNRIFEEYKFIGIENFSEFSAINWIKENGSEEYLYDILDVNTGKLHLNMSKLMVDYNKVVKVINNDKNNAIHFENIKNILFFFKSKWEKSIGKKAVKLYFEELCTIYKQKNKFQLNIESYGKQI